MKILIGIVVGATIGFLVGYFGKCSSGTCPLTSNPWTSMVIGAMLGFISTVG
jgi:F0F1-type ATP synthase assembly protein I